MPPLFGSLCICVACGLGTSSLSNAANQGLLRDVTSDSGSFQVSLLTDPAASPFGGQSASARIGDMHVQVQSAAMQELHAGQTVRMSGELKSMPIAKRLERRQNHQVAVLKVVSIERVQGEATWFRFANSVRSIIERGARSLPPNLRALFNGIVLGDDRNQTLATGSLFRRSGLSHITAVSGQNVAFVMAVFRPLLHRLRLSQRWLATAVIIVLFATMVRFEPSVLRATAMVAVSVTATTFGRPLSPLRALSLVAIGLIFLDPLLVYSLGFQLSVTACLGIALLTKPIARVLVGPSWLCEALAVTIADKLEPRPSCSNLVVASQSFR